MISFRVQRSVFRVEGNYEFLIGGYLLNKFDISV